MTTTEEIMIELGLDTQKFNQGLQTVARDTGKVLDARKQLTLELNVANFQSKLNRTKDNLKHALGTDNEVKLRLNTNQLQRDLTEAKRQLNNYLNTGDSGMSRFQSSLNNIGSGIMGTVGSVVGFAAIASGAGMAAKKMVELAGNLEQAKISFTTMLGSAEAADKMLRDLSDFAKKTPFELVGIRENAKQLMAMGIAQQNVILTMKMLGDVASGLSVPLDRLALAYGQVVTKGRLQGGELKQFTEAGVPLLEELSKNLGVSKAKISDMVEAGKIGATDVTKSFQTMTEEGGKFANLMDKQSQTLQGKWSNLIDSITQLGEKIGTKFLPILTALVDEMNNVTESYGDAMGQLFADTVGLITGTVSEGVNSFNNGMTEMNNGMDNTGQKSLTLGQILLGVWAGVINILSGVIFYFKTVGAVCMAVILSIGNYFSHGFKFVGDAAFQMGAIIHNYFQNLGQNIGAMVQTGVSLAIKAINKLIDMSNKSVGTSFALLQDVGPGKFSKGVEDGLNKIGGLYKKFQSDVRAGMLPIGDATKEYISNEALKVNNAAIERTKSILYPANTGGGGGIQKLDPGKILDSTNDSTNKRGGSAAKKAEDAKIKSLETQAKREIEAIKVSNMLEEDKARKIVEIYNKLEEDKKKIRGDAIQAEKEYAEKTLADAKRMIDSRKKAEQDAYDKNGKALKQNISDIEKLANEYGTLKNRLKEVGETGAKEIKKIQDEIDNLNKKLKDTVEGGQMDLGKRGIEAAKELKDALKGVSQSQIEGFVNSVPIDKIDAGTNFMIGGQQFSVEDLQNIKNLMEEIALVNANTTEDERKKAENESKKSKAQIIIDEIAAKKESIEQDIKDAEIRKAIKDQEVNDEITRIKTKMDAILAQINEENSAILQQDSFRRKTEEEFTKFFGEQISARKDMLADLRKAAEEAAAAIQSAGISKQEVNTDKGKTQINQTVNISSEVDAESFMRTLNSKIK